MGVAVIPIVLDRAVRLTNHFRGQNVLAGDVACGIDTYVVWHQADLKSKDQCRGSANGGQTWFDPTNPQDLFTVYIK